jgi:iron complex outermembrane recepter protein
MAKNTKSVLMTALLMGTALLTQPVRADDVETVTVTGTRIPRPELDLPNPVTTIGGAELQHSGQTNLADYLKRIPALAGSLGGNETAGFATPASADGTSLGGLNLLDLRNLGVVRTLVLIDGQRQVASSTGSAVVDTDSIPITLIDRVDVATGGASAIYGADGVSGVVNFVMKHDLEGLHTRLQAGLSQDGGGNKYLTATSLGFNSDDGKGNVTLTFEGAYQDSLSFTQRSFTKVGGATFFVINPVLAADPSLSPSATNPKFIPTNDAQFIFSAPTGAITTDLSSPFPNFLGNGQVFDPGTFIDGVRAIGSSGQPFANVLQGDFLPTQRRYVAQIDGHYDFSDFLHVAAGFKYASVDSKSFSTPPFDDIAILSPDNAFLPANVSAAIASNGFGVGILSEDYLAIRRAEETKRDTYRFNLHLNGDMPFTPSFVNNFRWDLAYVYGQTNTDDIEVGERVEDRFFAALDSVIDPSTGKPTCRSNLDPSAVPPDVSAFIGSTTFTDTDFFDVSRFPATFTPGPNSGCVAFNPFDPHANQKAAIGFITRNLHSHGVLMQHVVTGYLSGDFDGFKNWFAGPLSAVVGGEYRKESSASNPDPFIQQDLVFDSGTLPVKGGFDVSEFFAELSLPIIADKEWIKELSVDAAVRTSNYSTAGAATSWKVGGIWAPEDWLKLRATEAVATRAPNIGELFAPQQRLFSSVNDPCDKNFVHSGTSFRVANCQALFSALGVAYDPATADLDTGATIPNPVVGNPGLKPENARTFTAGVVIQPPDWNFSLTLDWYNVNITNAIVAPTAQNIADKCVDLSTIANPFCGVITRNPLASQAGSISEVISSQFNVATFVTSGLDITATWHVDSKDWFEQDYGTLDVHLIGNWLDKLSTVALLGQAPVESANSVIGGIDGNIAPKWDFNLDLVWNYQKWTVDYNIESQAATLNGTRQSFLSQPFQYAPQFNYVPGEFVQSIQVGYQVADNWNVYGGINNLFYQKPAIGFDIVPVDPLGRFFYVGVNIDTDSVNGLL